MLLKCVAVTLTVVCLFHYVTALKYNFGYNECTYSTFKFRCLGETHARAYSQERSGLTKFPDVDSGITCLRLTSNKIELFPKYLSAYSTVDSLDLSRNSIKELPINLKDMSSLELLDLSRNGLTTLSPVTKFPPSLRGLILANNMLTSLPEVSIPGLYLFDLSGNKFSEVPWTFCVSKELIRVDFSKNPLKGDIGWYIDIANSCRNRNEIKFCFFVDKPEIMCECETVGPLIGSVPNFCFGSRIRGEKFTCNSASSKEYAGRKLHSLEQSNVTYACGLLQQPTSGSEKHVILFGVSFGVIAALLV